VNTCSVWACACLRLLACTSSEIQYVGVVPIAYVCVYMSVYVSVRMFHLVCFSWSAAGILVGVFRIIIVRVCFFILRMY
jgi:hypothetical protein